MVLYYFYLLLEKKKMETINNNECESCSLRTDKIKFDNKSKSYLCDYCTEELNSLLNRGPKVKKIRERDLK